MYYSRDDFLFRSRPWVVPPRDGWASSHTAEVPPRPPWLLTAMVGAVRDALARRPAPPADRVESYAERPAYRELEFAVGFAPDDEPWG